MKKCLFILLSAMLLVGCGGNKPVETIISKNDVDLTGNAFQSFRLGGDIHLLMAPNTEDASKWMIRATAPVQKTDNAQIHEMTAEINLLDANGTKVREGFILSANDLASILPVFNAASGTEKTIAFSAGEGMKKDFSYKEAVELLNNVKKIALTLNTKKTADKVAEEATTVASDASTEDDQTQTTDEKKPSTLNELLKYYGIYGKLAVYEKHLRNGDKKRAKQVEDQLYSIERKVKNDASLPKSLRERFVDYIEDKEDEIEDRY
ncbi:MAG: hypothetical protein K6G25_13740 [Bacteroidales bacterium]|nr:hypothetical protein [Bacteroidales bacterium]